LAYIDFKGLVYALLTGGKSAEITSFLMPNLGSDQCSDIDEDVLLGKLQVKRWRKGGKKL
jgi:hypothetical protein